MPGRRTAAGTISDLHDDLLVELRRRTAELLGALERCTVEPKEPRVHALRLAARHLQAVVELLHAIHPDARELKRFGAVLRRILKSSSDLRDLQLHLLELRARGGSRTWQGQLRAWLEAKTERMERRTRRTFGRIDRMMLLDTAARSLPPPTPAQVRRAVRAVLKKRAAGLRRRLRTLAEQGPDAMHQVRLGLKRYRLICMLAACHGEHAGSRMTGDMKRLLDRLGHHHDAQVRLDQRVEMAGEIDLSAAARRAMERSMRRDRRRLSAVGGSLLRPLARLVGSQ